MHRFVSLLCFIVFLSSSSWADDIFFLARGDQALAARIQLIREAEISIGLMAYDFDPCQQSTRLVLDEMVRKKRDNPNMQVILALDAHPFEKNLTREQAAQFSGFLQEKGIDLLIFNDVIVPFRDHRNHMKLLLVDGKAYISGGRNHTDSYFGLSPRLNYRDHDLLVYGDSARDATEAFNKVISYGNHRRVRPDRNHHGFTQACLNRRSRDIDLLVGLSENETMAKLQGHRCHIVTFAADDPRFLGRQQAAASAGKKDLTAETLRYKQSTLMVIEFIKATDQTLLMENQFYLPSGQISAALRDLRVSNNQGVLVFTNRMAYDAGSEKAAISSAMNRAAKQDSNGNQAVVPLPLIGMNSSRHPFSPASAYWMIHSKSFVRDREDVMITSFNLDPRSYKTNLEATVIVENCPSLAREIEREIATLSLVSAADPDLCNACNDLPKPGWLDNLIGIIGSGFW